MRLRSYTAFVGLLLLASCNVLPTACTLMGCTSGVNVTFNRQPGPYRVEALVEGSPPVVFECAPASACTSVSSAFLPVVADEVTIRVTTPSGTVTQQVRPEYEPMYPNGRSCGAVCEQASVTIQLPA